MAQSYPNAVITFTVASISKTTADNSIFSAPPTYTTTTDPSGPRFLIRLLPADLAQPGTYTYTLTVTI